MNTASYAARKAQAIGKLVAWAEQLNPTPEIQKQLRGEVGNVTTEIRELYRLEALAELIATMDLVTSAVVEDGVMLPEIWELDKDEIEPLIADLSRPHLLALIGQELSEKSPRKTIVTLLEKTYMAKG